MVKKRFLKKFIVKLKGFFQKASLISIFRKERTLARLDMSTIIQPAAAYTAEQDAEFELYRQTLMTTFYALKRSQVKDGGELKTFEDFFLAGSPGAAEFDAYFQTIKLGHSTPEGIQRRVDGFGVLNAYTHRIYIAQTEGAADAVLTTIQTANGLDEAIAVKTQVFGDGDDEQEFEYAEPIKGKGKFYIILLKNPGEGRKLVKRVYSLVASLPPAERSVIIYVDHSAIPLFNLGDLQNFPTVLMHDADARQVYFSAGVMFNSEKELIFGIAQKQEYVMNKILSRKEFAAQKAARAEAAKERREERSQSRGSREGSDEEKGKRAPRPKKGSPKAENRDGEEARDSAPRTKGYVDVEKKPRRSPKNTHQPNNSSPPEKRAPQAKNGQRAFRQHVPTVTTRPVVRNRAEHQPNGRNAQAPQVKAAEWGAIDNLAQQDDDDVDVYVPPQVDYEAAPPKNAWNRVHTNAPPQRQAVAASDFNPFGGQAAQPAAHQLPAIPADQLAMMQQFQMFQMFQQAQQQQAQVNK